MDTSCCRAIFLSLLDAFTPVASLSRISSFSFDGDQVRIHQCIAITQTTKIKHWEPERLQILRLGDTVVTVFLWGRQAHHHTLKNTTISF